MASAEDFVVRQDELVRSIIDEGAEEHRAINLRRDDSAAAEFGRNVEDICNVGYSADISDMVLAPQERRHGRSRNSEAIGERWYSVETIMKPPTAV